MCGVLNLFLKNRIVGIAINVKINSAVIKLSATTAAEITSLGGLNFNAIAAKFTPPPI